jgi:hypothetical protein
MFASQLQLQRACTAPLWNTISNLCWSSIAGGNSQRLQHTPDTHPTDVHEMLRI